jgi:hypothetical protein
MDSSAAANAAIALSNIENKQQQQQQQPSAKHLEKRAGPARQASRPQLAQLCPQLAVVEDDSKPGFGDLGAAGGHQTVLLRPPFCLF